MVESVSGGLRRGSEAIVAEILHQEVLGAVMADCCLAGASHGVSAECVGLVAAASIGARAWLHDGALETKAEEGTQLGICEGVFSVRRKSGEESKGASRRQVS